MKRFRALDRERRSLLLEAYAYLAWARILKALPFRWTVPSLGSSMVETPHEGDPSNEERLRRIASAVHLASRHSWWECACLVRAVAAMKMLERRGIESTLYLGTARDADGAMIAHAWLRSGSRVLTGAEEMAGFAVVGVFGKRIETGEKRRDAAYG
ncbi:lasso peptide biosynthesis B2 protein [Paenibacillus sp. UNC496MF]|uniref:lasso peptide biosynthesis B2 protein n=1 Tax=Paenibacillus sp. UNC496MF TaxID=1502753 RepID=UPI00210E2E6D|nr:lasso peptide biosynthesis B2 protein [Paenibacillus sp. UNC496MF]